MLADSEREFVELRLDHTPDLRRMEQTLEATRANVLFIDSLGTGHGADERTSEIGRVLQRWQVLARDHNIAIVISHHVRKNQRACDPIDGHNLVTLADVRGSTSICAIARSVIAIDAPEFGNTKRRLRLVKASGLPKIPPPLGFEINAEQGLVLCDAPEERDLERKQTNVARAEQFLREALADGPR